LDSRYWLSAQLGRDGAEPPVELQNSAAAAFGVDLQSGRIIFAAPASSQLQSGQRKRLVTRT
jgi:hypothetical protein